MSPLISRGRCRPTGKSAYPLFGVVPYMVLRNRPGSITLPSFTFIRKYGEAMPLPNPVPSQILPSPIPFLHSPMERTAGAASCPDADLGGKPPPAFPVLNPPTRRALYQAGTPGAGFPRFQLPRKRLPPFIHSGALSRHAAFPTGCE